MRKPPVKHHHGRHSPVRPTHGDRIESLERRVSAIEATLNGRLARLEERMEHIGDSFHGLIDCNNAMVRAMREIRDALGLRAETGAEPGLAKLEGTK